MRTASSWTPRLAEFEGPIHDRLAAALAEDIVAGVLAQEERLPAHRDLAAALGVSVGTVTRAYATLQQRGLARAEKGRGMFAAFKGVAEPLKTDFSVNMPPPVLSGDMLSQLFRHLETTVDPTAFSLYLPAAGRPEHRVMLARRLAEVRTLFVDPTQVMITAGAQHALFVALSAAPPGPLAIEALTYPGALRAACRLGRRLVPIALDAEGVVPEALEAALTADNPPKVLYLVPTLQNPTASMMGATRRKTLADLARRHDLTIIEDDVYAVFAPETLPSIASLLPERTIYLSSLSKSIAPGLRAGYLTAPKHMVPTCTGWLEATASMANPMSGAILEYVSVNRFADAVAHAIRTETARRNTIAKEVLGTLISPAQPDALHIWVPLPVGRARDIVHAAAKHDITLAPPDSFMADPRAADAGIRLCLGNVSNRKLRPALETLHGLISGFGSGNLSTTAIV